jgi:dynein intermediate chain 1
LGIDQEQLTEEEKNENIFKTLTTNNPQAPHNLTKFSYKDRMFKTDDMVEQMVVHFHFDGDIIPKDSDDARDQEEFWDNKKKYNKGLLDRINVAVKEEFGKDPCKN